MEWKDLDNKAESYCASFLHFKMVSELLEFGLEGCVSEDVVNIETKSFEPEKILYLISKTQQQLFYARKAKLGGYLRASRYKPQLTEKLLLEVQELLLSFVPSYLRLDGLYNASKIMSGIL
jgi:hypothetical protein